MTSARVATKQRDGFRDLFHHDRFRSEALYAMQGAKRWRRDHVATPNQRRSFALYGDGPHLVQRQRDIITAAGIIERVSGLIGPVGSGAAVGCAERYDALIIHIEQFPVKLRSQRSSTATDTRSSKQAGKLPPDFFLLAQQSV